MNITEGEIIVPRYETMSSKMFKNFSDYIESQLGIKMPINKKTMLESRLQKRLRQLRIKSYADYYEYVFNHAAGQDELTHMIDVVTTNKTDFFREPAHFEYLINKALPQLIIEKNSYYKKIRIWSAGCSTGEEPYTLAIVLSEYSEANPSVSPSIIATDISTEVLGTAQKGIYKIDKVDPVPLHLKKKYLLKSRDEGKSLVRMGPRLRQLVEFRRLNLMDNDFGMSEPFDVIFCRNVIIYFDRPTQEKLLNKFYRNLLPGGFVFMGHSETLNGLRVPLTQVAPTIYRKLS